MRTTTIAGAGLETPGGSVEHRLGGELNEGMVLGRRKDHRRTVGNGMVKHWTHCCGDDGVASTWENDGATEDLFLKKVSQTQRAYSNLKRQPSGAALWSHAMACDGRKDHAKRDRQSGEETEQQ